MTNKVILKQRDSVSVTAERKFPTIWTSAIWLALFFGLQIVFSVIAVFIALVGSAAEGGITPGQMASMTADLKVIALPTIWALTASNLVITLAAFWFINRKPERVQAVGLDHWGRYGMGMTILLTIGVLGAAMAFTHLYATYAIPDIEAQAAMKRLFEAIPDTIGNTILLFVAVAILAPIAEELVFRGFLQNSLMHHMPPFAAIALASVIFAAIHFNFYAFPALAALGAAFGYLYYKTGSLRVNIAMHIINNALALALPMLAPQ
ncbi:CPBP family intramembrane glutamic endopeptidase [Sphingorhabdus sp. Alg239-R122]|uniref:CPBP family intramembrane glutamic endopeptidase n=1 Tax=Sphingorhabdus sp. Alg239-R122 TaxID=2305989 RepID=UPI0013DC9DBD|nr:CPBP family intramembrane glutamic endopeptidase [Sphingorhabdus sp. Alg239-R122]